MTVLRLGLLQLTPECVLLREEGQEDHIGRCKDTSRCAQRGSKELFSESSAAPPRRLPSFVHSNPKNSLTMENH